MIKYSVIIPIYNMEKYLRECINSIVSQKRDDVEIILVNDGSTDASLDICLYFKKCYNNVSVINKKNSGTTDTLIKGVEKVNGKYICFVDADDKIADNFFEIVDNYINKDYDILIYDFYRMFKNKKQKAKVNHISYGELNDIDINELKKFYFSNFNNYSLYRWDKIIKTEIVKKSISEINVKTIYFEDHIISFLNLLNSKRIYYLEDILYFYRMRKNSVSHRANKKIFDDLKLVEKEMQEIAIKNNYDEEQLYNLKLYFLYQYARNSLRIEGKYTNKKVKIRDILAIKSKGQKIVVLLYKFRLKRIYKILLKVKNRKEKIDIEEYFD